jgi:hypothetical protein
MDTIALTAKPDGTVRFSDVSFSTLDMTLAASRRNHRTNSEVVAVRFGSGSCWSSLGQPHEYVSACIRVFKVVGAVKVNEDGSKSMRVEYPEIIEVPIKKQTKKEN